MAASTIPVSAEENLGDPDRLSGKDIIHTRALSAADLAFPAAAIVVMGVGEGVVYGDGGVSVTGDDLVWCWTEVGRLWNMGWVYIGEMIYMGFGIETVSSRQDIREECRTSGGEYRIDCGHREMRVKEHNGIVTTGSVIARGGGGGGGGGIYRGDYNVDVFEERGTHIDTHFVWRDGDRKKIKWIKRAIQEEWLCILHRSQRIYVVGIDQVLEYGRYGVSKVLDTAYQGFLGVGTTFDIFQNILFPYSLNTTYYLLLDTTYWIFFPSWSLVLDEHAEVNLSDILKEPVEPEVQSMVDLLVKQATLAALRRSLVDTTVTIIRDITTISPTQPPPTKPKQSKIKRILMKSKKSKSQDDDGSLENRVYRLERQLMQCQNLTFKKLLTNSSRHISNRLIYQKTMMEKFKAYNRHPAHKALYNALVVSLSVNEDDIDNLANLPIQKKRRRDDHDKDPSTDVDKDSKKKKKKDHDVSSSKKTKDQPTSSKGTTPSKSSKTDKTVQADEALEDPDKEAEMEEEPAVNDVINDDDHSQDDTAPRLEQDWFSELEKIANAPEEFNDLLGSTFDFSNFIRHHLKKDKLTKVDLEGLICCKPLPLLGAPGRLYIPVEFFFNKDLEYLRSGNLEENKYTASFTKAKAARYELYGIEEMIPKQWSPSKVAYDKDAAYGIKYGYGYLKEIVVKRANQKEYIFKEADFPRLKRY
ncbi:hypothetical protein Tco_0478407 [Tanacetum coccineum]